MCFLRPDIDFLMSSKTINLKQNNMKKKPTRIIISLGSGATFYFMRKKT